MNTGLTKKVAVGIIALEGLMIAGHNLHNGERSEALLAQENPHPVEQPNRYPSELSNGITGYATTNSVFSTRLYLEKIEDGTKRYV